MPFKTQLTVNFGETDPAALVYFPNIFHYCHICMERFFDQKCGVPYSTLIQERGIGFPTVQIQAEFKSALRYGDVVDIELNVVRVGQKSLSLAYKVWKDKLLCAQVSQVVVAMDLNTQRSIGIPDYLRPFGRRFPVK